MKETNEGISRRKVLKRMGAGVAVAWTAPVLTSLGPKAYAQASPTCAQLDCLNFELCGTTCPECPGGVACARVVDGSCICWTSGVCFDCQSDSDCDVIAPGLRCAQIDPNCGCSSFNDRVCLQECGSSGRLPRGGKRIRVRS